MPFASLMSGTRLGNRNRIFNGAVISAGPRFQPQEGNGEFCRDWRRQRYPWSSDQLFFACWRKVRRSVTVMPFMKAFISHTIQKSPITACSVMAARSQLPIWRIMICGGNVLVVKVVALDNMPPSQTGCRTLDVSSFIVAAHEPIEYFGVNDVILQRDNYDEKIIRHMSHAYRIIFQGKGDVELAKLVKDQVPMIQRDSEYRGFHQKSPSWELFVDIHSSSHRRRSNVILFGYVQSGYKGWYVGIFFFFFSLL